MRDVFTRFLPEPIAAEMLSRSDGLPSIGAVRLWVTVMFIDLRGFTTFAETRPVEQVMAVLAATWARWATPCWITGARSSTTWATA